MSNRHDLTLSKIVLDHEKDAFVASVPDGSGIDPETDRKVWVRQKRMWLMMWMLIQTGVRVSELVSLRVEHMPAALGIDFIEVHKGKGGKSRNVAVTEEFAVVIEEYIVKVRPFTVPKQMSRRARSGLLFFNDRKRKFNRQWVNDNMLRIAGLAGINKRITPHKWRHRACTYALAQGQNIYSVKLMMGHSRLDITENYMHLVDVIKRGAGESLNQMSKEVMGSWRKNLTEYREQ